jgi:hypothetical protein
VDNTLPNRNEKHKEQLLLVLILIFLILTYKFNKFIVDVKCIFLGMFKVLKL